MFLSTVQVFVDEIIGKLCYLLVYFVGNVFSCASAGLSKVAWLRVKIAAYLISIGQLLCLLYYFRKENKENRIPTQHLTIKGSLPSMS